MATGLIAKSFIDITSSSIGVVSLWYNCLITSDAPGESIATKKKSRPRSNENKSIASVEPWPLLVCYSLLAWLFFPLVIALDLSSCFFLAFRCYHLSVVLHKCFLLVKTTLSSECILRVWCDLLQCHTYKTYKIGRQNLLKVKLGRFYVVSGSCRNHSLLCLTGTNCRDLVSKKNSFVWV